MRCHWRENPILAAGLLMELVYLCSGHLAPLEQLLGGAGALLSGVWLGLTIVLLLIGLRRLSPKGRERTGRPACWKKH